MLFKKGVRVQGKVVELVEEKGVDDSTFYPVVEFPYQGKTIKMKLIMGRNKGAHAVGEAIDLFYPKDSPEQAVELSLTVIVFPILILGASGYGVYYSITEM